ncbi:cohesin domain-containing protein [Novipirellula sp. SH528]|uniref:cohesin domain-containing protein n=1 Tax=Novipirellula sp. SH528 TaxID=3454466 RepID=UPI003FA12A0E
MATKTCKLGVQQLESRRLLASVSIPSVIVDSFSEATAPIEISDAQGVRAAEVRIQFDPTEVTTDASRIQPGSVWNGRGMVIANVDEQAGTIVAFVYSSKPVAHDDGGLIDIGFAVKNDRRSLKPIDIDLQKVRLNEGQIPLAEEPVAGVDPSDGKIVTLVDENQTNRYRSSENRTSESWTADVWAGENSAGNQNNDQARCFWQGGANRATFSSFVVRSHSTRPHQISAFAANSVETTTGPSRVPFGPLQPQAVDQAFSGG